MKEFFIYLVIINLISVIVCILDKSRARRGGKRISERTLFLLAFLGGGPFMYLTMRTIRHKTLHKRFMVGIPLIILLQIVVVYFILK